MTHQISGIHHVTAIASDPQRNLDFYTRVLGLRLVKVTVNFDDPGTYHTYFGDVTGGPGTALTFFPWPGARRGRIGNGQVAVTAFAVPENSLGYWQQRLKEFGVPASQIEARFDEAVLPLADPDGLRLELIAGPTAPAATPWLKGGVPAEHAISGFHGVTIWAANLQPTARLLTGTLGLNPTGELGPRTRFEMSGDRPGTVVDVLHRPGEAFGSGGAGTVHHVAWRTPSDDEQQFWRRTIAAAGYNVTPVQDRQYFHSIYFREPGGVLLEIATDLPGFTLDEPVERLGTAIKLPPWFEPQRAQIEQILPKLTLPQAQSA